MLKAYKIIYHEGNHEYTTYVIALTKYDASKYVSGQVMDVRLIDEVQEGLQLGTSGWNKLYHEPTYSQPSKYWTEYLKQVNIISGYED